MEAREMQEQLVKIAGMVVIFSGFTGAGGYGLDEEAAALADYGAARGLAVVTNKGTGYVLWR